MALRRTWFAPLLGLAMLGSKCDAPHYDPCSSTPNPDDYCVCDTAALNDPEDPHDCCHSSRGACTSTPTTNPLCALDYTFPPRLLIPDAYVMTDTGLGLPDVDQDFTVRWTYFNPMSKEVPTPDALFLPPPKLIVSKILDDSVEPLSDDGDWAAIAPCGSDGHEVTASAPVAGSWMADLTPLPATITWPGINIEVGQWSGQ
jgi:hypothetical protein